jgi:hypothetical protein
MARSNMTREAAVLNPNRSSVREKTFRKKRKKQLDEWQTKHPGTRRGAAQHLRAPGAKKKNDAAS